MNSAFYDHAARDLPNFPRAVIEQWFEHALSQGGSWPPRLDAYGFPDDEVWRNVLGHKPFVLWQGVTWAQQQLPLALDALEQDSARSLLRIIREFMQLAPPKKDVTVSNYRERIRKFLNLLESTRRLPVPPLLLQVGTQFEVLDGNHRLAALFVAPVLGIETETLREVWVARS